MKPALEIQTLLCPCWADVHLSATLCEFQGHPVICDRDPSPMFVSWLTLGSYSQPPLQPSSQIELVSTPNLCGTTINFFFWTPEEVAEIWGNMILHQKGHKPEAQQFTNHSSVSKLKSATCDIFSQVLQIWWKSFPLNYHLKLISLIPIWSLSCI